MCCTGIVSRSREQVPISVGLIQSHLTYCSYDFARSHKTLSRTIRDWALIYEFPGSDPSLKATFLTAHLDVVPVLPSSVNQWLQPPFSGTYDGTYIWGRGSVDTKSSLISIMVAIEHLLETTDWKPERTIVLGFGSDEERGGRVSVDFAMSGIES